ncbi:MAG: methionine--tRNA ligase, partial [Candidatus Longimicrobiales bacterium M2_2A_002]
PDHEPETLKPLDLRVARVTEAREHPNADRLIILEIDLGGETRQIVAGIAGKYELTALEGRRIVVVSNLQAATLRGEESQGMLLAAQGDGTLGLLFADAEPGTRLTTASMGEPADEKITIDDFAAHELVATEDGHVLIDGEPLEGAPLTVDRGIAGPVR